MATLDEVWKQLQLITAQLATLSERCDHHHARLETLQGTLNDGLATLATGLRRSLDGQVQTHERLAFQAVQGRTVIAGLDTISRDTRRLAGLGDLRPEVVGRAAVLLPAA